MNLISRLMTAHKPLLVQFMMPQLMFSHCHPMEHTAHISSLNIFRVSERRTSLYELSITNTRGLENIMLHLLIQS